MEKLVKMLLPRILLLRQSRVLRTCAPNMNKTSETPAQRLLKWFVFHSKSYYENIIMKNLNLNRLIFSQKHVLSKKLEEDKSIGFNNKRSYWNTWLEYFLTSLGKGWTNVHPDFQNGSKKITSHRFRVIQV